MKKKSFMNVLVVLALLLTTFGMLQVRMDQVLANPDAPDAMPEPIIQFPGIPRTIVDADTIVPDTTGAAGHTHYLQAVNKNIALFRKDGKFPGEPASAPPSGNPLFAATFGDFWNTAATDTICDSGETDFHHGQPNLLYDHMASRWVVADVAYDDVDDGPYFICVAVSNSTPPPIPAGIGDPAYFTSTYWNYYAVGTNEGTRQLYPDIPRLGLWNDAYYLSADVYDISNNGINRTPWGVKVWALNRDDLVNGDIPYDYVHFFLPEAKGYEHLVPTNLEGNPPATGTPNLFASIEQGKMYFWEFKVDWLDPDGNSTFGTATLLPNYTLNTDTSPIWAYGYLAKQPGTVEQLQVYGDRLMTPLQYRIVDGAPSLWVNHSVLSGGVTGVRWYEFRQSLDGMPFVYQQGTYQPDTHYRWLGSLGVDREGNMALGFSLSSSTMYPSIHYAGRLKNDAAGQLSQGEAVLYDGTGYYDDGDLLKDGPWGRQSHMSVDPLDECVFWYTNMYYTDTLTQTWQTRIGWFGFPECKGGANARISLHTNGTQGNKSSGMDFEMYSVASSANGRFVVFSSDASNLVDPPLEDNARRDVFVRDRDTDQDGLYDEPGAVSTTIVSRGLNGTMSNGNSWEVAISADGRYVGFSSDASNLVASDTNGTRDVFVYDRSTGSTIRVSVQDNTGVQGNAQSDQPFLSQTGRYVTFRSYATNLVSVPQNLGADIYVYDRGTGRTFLISTPYTDPGTLIQLPTQAAHSFTPTISYDGRYVAYASEATNLVAADANGFMDVFVYDRTTGVTTLASIQTGGIQGDEDSFTPFIAGNGQYVAFASRATNLVLDDTNGYQDIFVYDLVAAETTRVSVSFFGLEAQNGNSYSPSISYDGRFIAFASEASNLDVTLNDLNGYRDIFLHDRGLVIENAYEFGLTQRVSLSYDRKEANDWSFAPVVAPDGRFVIYVSEATNLVNNDTNNKWDVFSYDSQKIMPTFLSIPGNIPGNPGQTVNVPVNFNSNGYNIDATAFSVDFDEVCLAFDPTDSDSNGIPDSITFGVNSNYVKTVIYNANDKDGELDFSIYDQIPPKVKLPDTTLVTIRFTVKATCQALPGSSNSARVGFSKDPIASFGSEGVSIPGSTSDGFVRILDGKPGDCNGDGVVNAGDISGLVLEIFDADGSDPANTPQSTFVGNPVGCNPNQDYVVDAGDLSCTILIIQGSGAACTGGIFTSLNAADYGVATTSSALVPESVGSDEARISLVIPDFIPTKPGQTSVVPIRLSTGGQLVNSVVFSLNYNETWLSFDPTDGDGDGIPDAMSLDLPDGFIASVSFDPLDTDGEIDLIIFGDPFMPNASLVDGILAQVSLKAGSPANDVTALLQDSFDPMTSFGSISGDSLLSIIDDGSAFISKAPYRSFMPLGRR